MNSDGLEYPDCCQTEADTRTYKLAKLAGLLRSIQGDLKDYQNVHLDWEAERTGKGGKAHREPGPELAIENVEFVTGEIYEAQQLAQYLPKSDLRHRTEVALERAHEGIAQADVPATMAAMDGENEEAIRCASEGLRRAREAVGEELDRLVAELLVAARDGRGEDIEEHNQPAWLEPGLPDSLRRMAWELQKEPDGLKAKELKDRMDKQLSDSEGRSVLTPTARERFWSEPSRYKSKHKDKWGDWWERFICKPSTGIYRLASQE